MPSFKQVATSASWKARIAAIVAAMALLVLSFGVPEAGGCGGAPGGGSEGMGPAVDPSSNLGSDTIKLDPPSAILGYRAGMTVTAVAPDGSSRAGQVTLTTVDFSNSTFTTGEGNWSTLIPGLQPGDHLLLPGSTGGVGTASKGGETPCTLMNLAPCTSGGGGGGSYPPPSWPAGTTLTDTYTYCSSVPFWASLSWTAAQNVSYYNVYGDGNYVGNTSSLGYSVDSNEGSTFMIQAVGSGGSTNGPSITINWSGCQIGYGGQSALNGLRALTSVPGELGGPGFATWFDSHPGYASELMPYVVGCALPPSTSLSFRGQVWKGELGLAPTWSRQRLDRKGQELVTACLLARYNSSGQHVELALRGGSPSLYPDAHSRQFRTGEAAWFGNLFVSPPQKFFCTMGGEAHGRWLAAGRGRICDARNGTCGGMTDLGDCARSCSGLDPADGHWSSCSGGGVETRNAITTFLPQ